MSDTPDDRQPPEGGGYWFPESPKKKGPIIAAVVILAVIAIAIGWIVGNSTSSSSSGPNLAAQVDPTIAYGGHLFVDFACAQCHGMQGKGGPDPTVPKLQGLGSTMSPTQLASIINDGVPGQTVPAGGVTGTTGPYMPTWRNILSQNQVAALVTYIGQNLPAVPGATPEAIPTGQGNVVAGMALFDKYGCENCHGANGLGGVVNPSPDGTIPFLGGKAFNAQFPTDQSIIDVITSGSVIGKNPITSMPHWGSIIPPAQMQQLVNYIRTLPGPS